MHDELFRIPSRHGHAMPSDEARAPLQRRFEAASACMYALSGDLPWKFLAELAPMLQLSCLGELSAPPDEIPFLHEILAGIARGLDDPDRVGFSRCVAAAMFYFYPHELPQTPPPSRLPLWIRLPYLRWSLALPQNLHELGEADGHARWLEEWLKTLAVDLADGRGFEDLPEYQRPRIRRELDLLQKRP
jgi:hypothetical protein